MTSTNSGTCSPSNQRNVYFPLFSSHPQLVGQRAVDIFKEVLHQIFAMYLARKTCCRSSDAHGGIDDPSKLITLFNLTKLEFFLNFVSLENLKNLTIGKFIKFRKCGKINFSYFDKHKIEV